MYLAPSSNISYGRPPFTVHLIYTNRDQCSSKYLLLVER